MLPSFLSSIYHECSNLISQLLFLLLLIFSILFLFQVHLLHVGGPYTQKKRRMSKNQRIQMVSTLQTLQMENGMRRGAFTIVAKCFSVACSMVHCLWNRVVHMHTHGHIISPEFHSHKTIPGDLLSIHQSSSVRESRTSHYTSNGPKESWQHCWGCSFPQNNSRRPSIYPSEFICEGIKNITLQKQWAQRKLAALLGVSKTMVHVGLLI